MTNLTLIQVTSERLPSGVWQSYNYIDVYRTQDGRAYFEFGFMRLGNHIQVDILDMPEYGYRDTSLHATHRLQNGNGTYYICFGDASIISDMSMAKKWAGKWAELTWRYITSGTPFPNN
jgi:hypothetical protein